MSEPPQSEKTGRINPGYLIGLGIGLIPVALAIIIPVNATFLSIAGCTYGLVILVMIICLSGRELRSVGYGLLTMVLIGPVVAAVGCNIVAGATRP